MAFFLWSDKYDLACPPIDQEHKRLFAMAEKLHNAMAAGQGGAVLKSLFGELAEYTVTHFRHEETLMRGSAYPTFREHKAEHDALTAKVVELQKAMGRKGELALTLETMRFLREWLDQHICKSDRVVADWARSRLKSAGSEKRPLTPARVG
jgi:hemerythrin-like metal-binding protein